MQTYPSLCLLLSLLKLSRNGAKCSQAEPNCNPRFTTHSPCNFLYGFLTQILILHCMDLKNSLLALYVVYLGCKNFSNI